MCHPDPPTEGWLGVSLPQGEHVRVKPSSRGSHTTRLAAEQVREEDTRSRAVCRRRGPWGKAFPAGLCSCPRGNTGWTSRPGRSGWCPRGSLLQDTPPAGSWASHVWPPPRGIHTGVLPTCTSTEESPIPDAPPPVAPEFRLLDWSMSTMNRKLVLALSAIPLFLPFRPPTFRPRSPPRGLPIRMRPAV